MTHKRAKDRQHIEPSPCAIKNLQNDVIAIVDKNGNQVARYSYDAWGMLTDIYSDDSKIGYINPFRYRGYYYDSEISLYYLQSRYYDPRGGRFLNADMPEFGMIEQGALAHNLFAYCGNDCVCYVDDIGEIRMIKIPRSSKIFGTIITISQFKTESNLIVKNLKPIRISMNLVVIKKDAQSLIDAWNNLKQTKLVIINCHGNPKSMNGVTEEKAKNLSRLPIRLLILLACNVGHYDYKKSNIAYTFYKKIIGVGRMLCSDGTVYSWNILNFRSIFESRNDNTWKSYSKRNSNFGWLLYGDGRRGVNINTSLGKKINLISLIKELLFL